MPIIKNKKIMIQVVAVIGFCGFVFFAFGIHGTKAVGFDPNTGVALSTVGNAATGLSQSLKSAGSAALKGAAWGIAIFGILYALNLALWKLLAFAYSLLNAAVNTALDPNWFRIPAVLDAWRLIRDFVNIWFILILLFIAIAVILRLSNYQAKKLLPTLILIALIVNFSLPITEFIIDISNVIAFQFLNAICPETVQKAGVEVCDFSANVENAFQLRGFSAAVDNAIVATENPAENPAQKNKPGAMLVPEAHAILPAVVVAALPIVGRWLASAAIQQGIQYGATALTAYTIGNVSAKHMIDLLMDNIMLLFALFVILSMALLFLIRIISLVFLVILSPFGFASMILPATQKYSNMWWDYLFKQSFFAPFSLFFLWASLHLMGTMQNAFLVGGETYELTNPTNGRLLFFIFSGILLYGSLWIAKKMGAIGADTVMGWGKWIKGAATGFVGGFAARSLIAPVGTALSAAGLSEKIGSTRWLGGLAPVAGVETKRFTDWLSTRGKADKSAEAKAALGLRLSPSERAAYFKKLNMAEKEAMLRKMKAEEREAFIPTLSADQQTAARGILGSSLFKPEERAKMDTERLERLSKEEQIREFSSLSQESQQQFLLNMKDETKKAEFVSELETANPETARKVKNFLRTSPLFTAEQRISQELAEFQRLGFKQQVEQFSEKSNEFKNNFLLAITDDAKRAEFIANLGDPTKGNNPGASRKANEFLETSGRFTAAQKAGFIKARQQLELKTAERENGLNKFIEGLEESQRKDYFKAADDNQKLAWFENYSKDGEKIKTLRMWVAKDIKPEETDKFHRDTLRRASNSALSAYMDSVQTENGKTDINARERIISLISTQQRASLFDKYITENNSEMSNAVERVVKTLSTEDQQRHNNEVAKIIDKKSTDEIVKIYGKLSKEVGETFVKYRGVNENIDTINDLDISKPEHTLVIQQMMEHVKSAGLAPQYIKKLNPVYKVQYIDQIGVDKTTGNVVDQMAFDNALIQEIKKSSARDFEQKITVKALDDSRLKKAILSGGEVQQLWTLTSTPEKAAKLKEMFSESIFETMRENESLKKKISLGGLKSEEVISSFMTEDDFRSEAITNTFDKKYNNKVLAEEIKNLWSTNERSLTPAQKTFKKRIFV